MGRDKSSTPNNHLPSADKRRPCSVSYLPAPVRTPPERVLPEWENPPPNCIIEPPGPYLVLVGSKPAPVKDK